MPPRAGLATESGEGLADGIRAEHDPGKTTMLTKLDDAKADLLAKANDLAGHGEIPDLPAFLIIPQSERAAAWKGRKLTKQGVGFRTLDAAEQRHRSKLQREYDRVQAQKRADRLKQLRENYR